MQVYGWASPSSLVTTLILTWWFSLPKAVMCSSLWPLLTLLLFRYLELIFLSQLCFPLCTMLFSRGLYQISRNIRGSLNGCRRFISGRRQDHQFLLSHNYQSPGCSTDTVISLRSFTCTLFDFGQPLLVVKQRKLQRNPYFLLLRSEVQNLVSTFTHLVPKWNDDF